MANSKAIAQSIGALCEAFGRAPSKETFKVYELALKDVPDDKLALATTAVLQSASREFMPPPGQLRALAFTSGRGVEAACYDAWLVFEGAVQRFGSRKSVNFKDGLINAAVRMLGGWVSCCAREGEAFDVWLRKDFIATYGRLMTTGCHEEQANYLIGENEAQNAGWVGRTLANGKIFELPAPEEVGCAYEPAMLAPPVQQALPRGKDIPRLEVRRP
jgi:hypothetical protein